MSDHYDQHDTKHLIFLAAKKEFAEKGFGGARIGSIARRAGVRQSLIHYHFGSKEQLYTNILENLAGIFEQKVLDEFMTRNNLTAPEKLYMAVYHLINIHLDVYDPDFKRIVAHEIASGMKQFVFIIQKTLFPGSDTITGIIREGVANGDFVTDYPYHEVMLIYTFIAQFEHAREFAQGSSYYMDLFEGPYKTRLLNFMLTHTFRALWPEGKAFHMPLPPHAVLHDMDMLINDIRQSALFHLAGGNDYTHQGESHV